LESLDARRGRGVITFSRGVPQRFGSVNWGRTSVGFSGVVPKSAPGVVFLVSESREVMNVRQASQYLGISPGYAVPFTSLRARFRIQTWLILRSIQRSRMVFLSFPTIAKFECGNLALSDVTVTAYPGRIPRYCDACRTFITSRDSLTRNTTPGALRHTPLNPTTGAPQLTLPNLWGTPREKVMTPRHAERQGFQAAVVLTIGGYFRQSMGSRG